MERKTKILVMASTFPRWKNDSTPPFVQELSKYLSRDNEIVVLAPYSTGSCTHEEIDGLTIVRFNYWPFKKKLADGAILPNLKTNKFFLLQVPFFILFEYLALRRLAARFKPDVIHAHWIIPQGIVAVLMKKTSSWNGPIVCTTHGGDIYGLQFLNKLKKWVLQHCAHLTVVSSAIKDQIKVLGIVDIPIDVVPMGVDTTKFNAGTYDSDLRKKLGIKDTFLLYVGRLSEKKGVEYLLRAMPEVIAKIPNVTLVIVGNGELDKPLRELADNLNITGHIVFTGGISNSELPAYYATADIFIGPSIIARGGDREGFPVSFMEAMASHTSLITSDIGIFDQLINRVNALKAKEKSGPDLARCIIEMIENKDLREAITTSNASLIEHEFSLHVIGEKYGRILAPRT